MYEDDLIEVLSGLGIKDKVIQGKIKCKFTGEIIKLDNFHAVFPESGDIKVVCDKPEAILKFNDYLRQHPEIL